MITERIVDRINRGRRWAAYLAEVGVKVSWVAPSFHYAAAIAVGVLVATGFAGVATTLGVLYLSYCIYDVRETILRALFAAREEQLGRPKHREDKEDLDS